MEKIPQGRYTREFQEETARLIMKDGMSASEVTARLFHPKSMMANWGRGASSWVYGYRQAKEWRLCGSPG